VVVVVVVMMVAASHVPLHLMCWEVGQIEPAPTSAPSRMDDMWPVKSFLLGSSSLAKHGSS
jgi:hypothetical protein